MHNTIAKLGVLLAALTLPVVAAGASQKVNPASQINWPLVTGSGVPAGSCSSSNYGQPYTNTINGDFYVCASGGWVKVTGGGGGGGVGGSGTTGFIPLWAGSTTLGNSPADYGITLASVFTFPNAVQVVCSGCSTQVDLTYNSGHAPTPGSSTTASFAPNSSGQGTLSEAGAAYSRICTAANGICGGGGGGGTISGLTYTATDTTIVAGWTTSSAADSNLFCGGKPAIDNGFQQGITSGHLAIVTGLNPSSSYSCFVSSSGTSSSPQAVSTSSAIVRTPIRTGSLGSSSSWTTTGVGDNPYNVVSSDNVAYAIQDDTTTNSLNSAQALVKFTNETNMTISTVNAMTAFGNVSVFNGTDGPGKTGMSNKLWGLWSQSGVLCAWEGRLANQWPQSGWYPWLMCDHGDHGATWNTFQAPATYTSTGTEIQGAGMFPYPAMGPVSFVQYAADDGTVGYTTTGNGIDGANGWVYMNFNDGWWNGGNYLYLMRVPRVYLNSQAAWTKYQFWKGTDNPTPGDFNNDDNWTYSFDSKQPILTGFGTIGTVNTVYVPGFNYYVMATSVAGGATGFLGLPSGNVFNVYAAPTPAGPFTQIYTNTWSTSTANYDPIFLMRPIQANSSSSSLVAPLLWSSQNVAHQYYANFTMSSQPATLSLTSFCGGGLAGTSNTTFSIANNSSCSGSMNVAQGSSLLVLVLADVSPNDAAVATRVYDTAGNTFTPISIPLPRVGGTAGYFRGQWYLCNNCNGNAADVVSATAQFAAASPYSSISVWQIAGGPVSGDGNILTGYTASGTSVATTSFNTSYAREFCAAVGSKNGSSTVGTAGTGFTLSSSNIYGSEFTGEHVIFTSTQTGLAPSMTWVSSGLLSLWEACVGY